jgi:hypothetical protein
MEIHPTQVTLAFSNQPHMGTAAIYVDGKRAATFDERAARAPSLPYLRAQAEAHRTYKEAGIEVQEVNLDWPMPEVLPKPKGPKGPVKTTGKANDNFDQDVRRTEAAIK